MNFGGGGGGIFTHSYSWFRAMPNSTGVVVGNHFCSRRRVDIPVGWLGSTNFSLLSVSGQSIPKTGVAILVDAVDANEDDRLGPEDVESVRV